MRSKMILLSTVLMLAVVLSACVPAATTVTQTNQRTISVTGTGTTYLAPDIAYIYIGVHTENKDIAEAVDSNNSQAQRVVDALLEMDVEAKDIQTSNFSVWSSQQYDPITSAYSGVLYMVDNTVYVTVRDLSRLGELLDTAIQAGANNINSIQFDVADKSESMADARQLAVDNADNLAKELAASAGVRLGEIQTISYTDYGSMPYYGYGMGGGGGGAADAPRVTPINPGQIQISVSVSITYEIK